MELKELELDILGEIGNVSIGGAASSLSKFVNKMVTISIPVTKKIPFKEIKNKFEPSCVFTEISYKDDLSGSNVMLMRKEEALNFSRVILREKLNIEEKGWGELSRNALTEVFNIMVGNMSGSMSKIFHKNISIEPPKLCLKKPKEIKLYDDEKELVVIWFDMKIEDLAELKLIQIIGQEEAEEMLEIVKGEHQL